MCRAVTILLLSFTGACGPAWTVVKKAPANPFAGKSEVAVASVRFSGGIGTAEHRSAIGRAFRNGLTNALDGILLVKQGNVTLQPIVTRLATGTAVNLGADPAELEMRLETHRDGALVETIAFHVRMTERGVVSFAGGTIKQGGPGAGVASLSAFSDDERVEMLAGGAGRLVAEYVEQRLAGP